jgi:intracellular multiplication protein IcmP
MAGPAANHEQDDSPFVVGAALCMAALLIWLLWWAFHAQIAYYSLWINWTLMAALDWLPWAAEVRRELAQLAGQARTLEPLVLWKALSISGLFFAPLTLLATALLARRMWTHPSNVTRRGITAETLPWIMAKHAPAIIPMLYAPNLLKNDPPEHRSMLAPDEWVTLHRLVVDERLDHAKTRELLIGHLGQRIRTPLDLHPHERALFAVFGARLLSGGEELEQAQVLLDRLNRSCHTGTYQGRRGYPDLSIADAAFHTYATHPEAARWVASHGYARTLLHAMHLEAVKRGKLPSSHFRWLKGIDRSLWAALNTTGRKTPFIESVAVFTQTRWESYLETLGTPLQEPHLDDAITAIEAYLTKVGLIRKPKRNPYED